MKQFVREWLNQSHVNGLLQTNLMSALAAFEHGDYFFILFERAEGTLYSLLMGEINNPYTSKELWAQVKGLAVGLARLHGFSPNGVKSEEAMFHRDLKPANILIVNNVMKIADFGISNYRPAPKFPESTSSGGYALTAAGTYFPPPGVTVDSAKFDLYSLGCIMSEIACFDAGTHSRVDRYRNQRQADNVDGQSASQYFCYLSTATVKGSVTTEHSDILEAVKEYDMPSSNEGFDYWKFYFYHRAVFDMIEEILRLSDKQLTAHEVAESITNFSNQADHASEARRQSSSTETQHSKQELWENKIDGEFAKNSTIPECKL